MLRSRNSFDRIIIDAIYRSMSKLLSIVCPELDVLNVSGRPGSVAVDEDSMTVFFRHVRCGNNLPLRHILGMDAGGRMSAHKKKGGRERRDHRRKRPKKEAQRLLLMPAASGAGLTAGGGGAVRVRLEPVASPDIFDGSSFQGCTLDDFAKLLQNCVRPELAHDGSELDRFGSFNTMIRLFFNAFDRDGGESISREELLEPLERVIAALVHAGQLSEDATKPKTAQGQLEHLASCTCISCALDKAIRRVKQRNASQQPKGSARTAAGVDEISYDDFSLFMDDCVKSNRNDRATSRALYELIRGGGTGQQGLTAADIRRVLQDIMHLHISDDMAEKMLAVVDEDGSGTVSVEEFKVAIFDENLADGDDEEDDNDTTGADLGGLPSRPVAPTRVGSWGSFNNSHDDDQAQQQVVDMVTNQSVTIFGLACLTLYRRLRGYLRSDGSIPAKDWQNVVAKWDSLLADWNKWTPNQFLSPKSFVYQACAKINVELYRLGYRSEARRQQNQIPKGWMSLVSSDIV